MPNIQEYSATGEITPTDKGIQAAEVAGRRLGQFGSEIASSYRQIGDVIGKTADLVERHMEVMESSELYKTGTELKQNIQQQYVAESALPQNRNNPHFGDQFMATVDPQLDKWGSGAGTEHGKQLAATLKANIRNEIFNYVTAGQSEMDMAHVDDNHTQTRNHLASGVITDPSEINLRRTLGTMRNANQGMTMNIPDVAMRERAMTEYNASDSAAIVMARYVGGVANSIKNQIADSKNGTGAESPALDQLNNDIKAQLGFEYLSPAQQTSITQLPDEAVRQGQELYRAKHDTEKSALEEAGKADYAKLHNVITNLALAGQGPTPDLIDAAQQYARRYGATNPGEVASLDDFIVRGQDRAQSNSVQPYNQSTRDAIQAGFSLPKGDPRRPTLASLMQDYSHGKITRDDLSNDTEILNKLDKPDTDPSFRPAWENFTRWQNQIVQSIGTHDPYGAGAARAQFLHDSTAAFMVQGHGGGGWDKALDNVTNAQNPHSFGHVVQFYENAANKGVGAAQWLQQHDQFQAGATTAPAYGSKAAPVYPTNHHAAPVQPTKIDQKAVDQIRGL